MTTSPRPLSAETIAVPDRHSRQLGACRHADPELFFPVSASGGYLRVLLVLHDGFVGGHLANTSCMIIHEGIAPETHYFAADRVVSCEGSKVASGAATTAWRETPVGSRTVSS